MKSFRSSLAEFNTMHPLLAAFVVGLMTVGLMTLVIPNALTRTDAWLYFLAIGAGGGIGQWFHQTRVEGPGDGPTGSGAEHG